MRIVKGPKIKTFICLNFKETENSRYFKKNWLKKWIIVDKERLILASCKYKYCKFAAISPSSINVKKGRQACAVECFNDKNKKADIRKKPCIIVCAQDM